MNGREKRRVKLTDIAAKTGYTVGTISKALQNKEGISQETREAIMKAAKEQNRKVWKKDAEAGDEQLTGIDALLARNGIQRD